MSHTEAEGGKPWWWKPLWIGTLLVTMVLAAVNHFLLHFPLERVVGGVPLTLLMMGIAYYIRIRPSKKVNRGVYLLLGFSPIGFGLWLLYAFSRIGGFLATHLGPLGPYLSFILNWVPYGAGVCIGDWIGRRRDYRLPLSP